MQDKPHALLKNVSRSIVIQPSNFLIHKAMREYGINNFFVVEIEKCNDELLDDKEKYYINKYDSYYNGYNSTPGGRGIIS